MQTPSSLLPCLPLPPPPLFISRCSRPAAAWLECTQPVSSLFAPSCPERRRCHPHIPPAALGARAGSPFHNNSPAWPPPPSAPFACCQACQTVFSCCLSRRSALPPAPLHPDLLARAGAARPFVTHGTRPRIWPARTHGPHYPRSCRAAARHARPLPTPHHATYTAEQTLDSTARPPTRPRPGTS